MKNKKPFASTKYLLACLNPFTPTLQVQADLSGLRYRVYKRDVIGREIFKTGSHDRVFTQWLIDRFTGRGPLNFVDAGANLGYFSCLFGQLAGPQGKVLAVEPEPDNHRLLRSNLLLNGLGNVEAAQVALGEADGEAVLNIYKGSNRGRHTLTQVETARSIKVPVVRLDDLVARTFAPGARIDFFKIDVEGYEPFVMRGAQAMLERTEALAVEYSPYLLKSHGDAGTGFIRQLAERFPNILQMDAEGIRPTRLSDFIDSPDQRDLIFQR